ncbi:DUF6484 domain-containing protein [Pseudosulfitobacter sp. DSM 107133]|jgi:hypothetical protein|uniref:DUF6484 domain-containing protein n=1 Tax=Pseudosulfitobacter sp. DSM 107133 TaxID=2883100 RepID=UPI000DF1F333|nr:DUF6484 domain-containing protein [Pseudosulfitobacter sp. DSM 107133]UOA28965.1 hypothetical protein DSM107133_03724 [Pseudosulfitobacter sp. DSM 107133]
MDVAEQIDGVVIGLFLGFENEKPLVVFPSNPEDHALPARALCALSAEDAGCEVALLFEDGARTRPLIIGRIVEPARQPTPHIQRDGETVRIFAEKRIELRVGKSAIIMDKDGHITIRGENLVSHASRANHIRGGSVNLN